jgi:hypothetical protein
LLAFIIDISKINKVYDISNKRHEFHHNRISNNSFGLLDGSINGVYSNRLSSSRFNFNFANIQTKLKVSHPSDPSEQEADIIADQVVNNNHFTSPLKSENENENGGIDIRINRKCACEMDHKVEDEEIDKTISRRPANNNGSNTILSNSHMASINSILNEAGKPLDKPTRDYMEPRFGYDFSNVRIHSDGEKVEGSAGSLNALAYTVGNDIVFGMGQYNPNTFHGKKLLAHELTHVIQQRGDSIPSYDYLSGSFPTNETGISMQSEHSINGNSYEISRSLSKSTQLLIQRACLSGPICTGPMLGSAEDFSNAESAAELPSRSRRARMTPSRARSTGHGGPAKQLKLFLDFQSPGLSSNVHGIFIDQDMSPGTGAYVQDCDLFVPKILGASKPCMFVPAALNQQAFKFNTDPSATMIGGRSREEWRVTTVQTLTHEIQHIIFDSTSHVTPTGVRCSRTDVAFELSELNAIMSEFPIGFKSIPIGAGPTHPSRIFLDNWFNFKITNSSEGIRGILQKMRCKCSCSDVDAFVVDTFNFVSSGWTLLEKNAFNDELRKSRWTLSWPL